MKPTPITFIPESHTDRVIERLNKYGVPTPNGCIEWSHALSDRGYGHFKVSLGGGVRRTTGAHRAAWLSMRGPIMDTSLTLDHLCRNKRCINIEHLELVTQSVNTKRADHSNKAGRSGVRAKRGCQIHGHDDGHEVTRKDGYKVWRCHPCILRRKLESASKKN